MRISISDATTGLGNAQDVARASASPWLFFLAALLVVCDITVSSRLYVLTFGLDSRSIFLAVALVVVGVFTVIAFLERDFAAVAVAVFILVFFLAYLMLFTAKSGVETNWNALAQTYGMLSFIVFYELAKRRVLARFMRLMLYMLTAYLMAYVIVASLHYGGIIDIPEPPGVFTILHDRERGQRLFMAGAFATFVWTYSLARLNERFNVGYMFAFLAAAAASALSLSRVYILVNAAVALSYLFTRNVRLVTLASFIAYLAIAGYLLFGVLQPPFNPFDLASSDTTIVYRKHEYDVMATLIRLEPVFGIGLYRLRTRPQQLRRPGTVFSLRHRNPRDLAHVRSGRCCDPWPRSSVDRLLPAGERAQNRYRAGGPDRNCAHGVLPRALRQYLDEHDQRTGQHDFLAGLWLLAVQSHASIAAVLRLVSQIRSSLDSCSTLRANFGIRRTLAAPRI